MLHQLHHCYTNNTSVTPIITLLQQLQHCYTNYNIDTAITTLLHLLKHCYNLYNIVTKLTLVRERARPVRPQPPACGCSVGPDAPRTRADELTPLIQATQTEYNRINSLL